MKKEVKAIFKRELKNRVNGMDLIFYERANIPKELATQYAWMLAAFRVIFEWNNHQQYKVYGLSKKDFFTIAVVWCKELAPLVFHVTNYRVLERKINRVCQNGTTDYLNVLHQNTGNQNARKHAETSNNANTLLYVASNERTAVNAYMWHLTNVILYEWINKTPFCE